MYDFNAYASHVLLHANPLPRATDLRHVGLGLTSETGEIADHLKAVMVYGTLRDDINLKEESGDGLWFTGLGCRLINRDLNAIVAGVLATPRLAAPELLDEYALIGCSAAAEASLLLLSIAKGDDDPALVGLATEQFSRMLIQFHKIGSVCGFTLGDAAEGNKAKLEVRNGGQGFDLAKTLKRDKAAERAAIAAARE